jgi:hypothetical protein
VTLGRSIYHVCYYLIYLSSHDSPFSIVFLFIRTGGVHGVNEGGDNSGSVGVDWSSGEDLVYPLETSCHRYGPHVVLHTL